MTPEQFRDAPRPAAEMALPISLGEMRRLHQADADRDRLARSNAALIEALQEFIDIDENRGGLFAQVAASSDLVLALVNARVVLAKTKG